MTIKISHHPRTKINFLTEHFLCMKQQQFSVQILFYEKLKLFHLNNANKTENDRTEISRTHHIVLNFSPQLQLQSKYNGFRGLQNSITTTVPTATAAFPHILPQYHSLQHNHNHHLKPYSCTYLLQRWNSAYLMLECNFDFPVQSHSDGLGVCLVLK